MGKQDTKVVPSNVDDTPLKSDLLDSGVISREVLSSESGERREPLHERIQCARLFNIPDQSKRALTRWLAFSLVLKLIICVMMVTLFSTIRDEEDRVLLTIMSVAVGFAFTAGSYGGYSEDRGWLIMAFLLEVVVMNNATPFAYHYVVQLRNLDATCGVLDSFASVFTSEAANSCQSDTIAAWLLLVLAMLTWIVSIVSAWLSLRLGEKLQDHLLRVALVGADVSDPSSESHDHRCKLPNLPNQSVSALRKWTYLCATLQLLFGVAFIVIGSEISGTIETQLYLLAGSLMISAITTLYSTATSRRYILLICATHHMWDLTKMTPLMYYFFIIVRTEHQVVKIAGLRSSPFQSSSLAALMFIFLSFFIELANAWLTMRVSERIQDENKTVEKATKWVDFGNVRLCTGLLGVSCALEILYTIAIFITASFVGRNASNLYHYWFASLVLIQAASGVYGAVSRDRGWLLFLFVLSLWSIAAAWDFIRRTFTVATAASVVCELSLAGCSTDSSKVLYNVDIGLVCGFVAIGGCLAISALILSERVQQHNTALLEAAHAKGVLNVRANDSGSDNEGVSKKLRDIEMASERSSISDVSSSSSSSSSRKRRGVGSGSGSDSTSSSSSN